MQQPRLFARLPDYVSTPDGMAIDSEGNLVLACPNYADPSMPGVLLKFDRSGKAAKWVDVPVSPETGHAFPMGIAFGPDGDLYICDNQGWSGKPELVFKGRILRLRIRDNRVVKTTVVAHGMEHPNGIRINRNHLYVTHSMLSRVKDPSGLLVSCVYRFRLDEENISITNTLEDPNIFTTFITHNRDIQYGADGIEFDKHGNLYVGNFGDGAVHKITFNDDGTARDNMVWARDPAQLKSTDGMIIDSEGNISIADFCANAVARVSPNGKVTRIAQSPDADGLNGELNQPGEPIIWQGRLIVTCFDLVTGPQMVNTKHEMPATLSELALGRSAP
ncbi:MAG: SMP-30/gluconolactonase/LRE family protein [Spirochaetia bacterium]|jgi:sugar lactone lactonase YvrE